MPKIPDKSNVLLGGRNYKRECNAKEVCLQLQQKYVQTVYPVCPVLCSMIKQEGAYRVPNIPKMNHPMLDSILKILVVFENLMQLRPDLETVVRCAHSENFLKETIEPVRNDLSALPQWLEKDFPDTSKNCKELVAELNLAELRYTMNGGSCGYLLPDDIEFGNWATFLEWRERKLMVAQSKGFSQEIEVNQLTCHYPAEAIKATNKIYDELRPLVKILSEQVKQSNRDKIEQNQMLAGFLQKSAGTGQEIKPVKESKSKSLVTESQSARTTAILSAASELNQIADNFEGWAKKQRARFIDPNGVKPPAVTLAKVEDWVNTYLSKQRLIAVFFNHPHLSYDVNSGLSLFITTESKEFHLIIDVFRLHMPAIATSLKELYDEFWEDVACRIECYKRSKKVRQREQQGDISPSTLIGESADDVSPELQPTLFLDGTVARLVKRLRHIAEMAREELAAEKPAETQTIEASGTTATGEAAEPVQDGLSRDVYKEIDLAERTLTIGTKTINITSEPIWGLLKTLVDNKRQGKPTPRKDGEVDWKNSIDMLRRLIGKKELHQIVQLSNGLYYLRPSVNVKHGTQVGIRKTKSDQHKPGVN